MSKRTLNETQMLDELFDAISSGEDASKVNEIISSELETIEEETTDTTPPPAEAGDGGEEVPAQGDQPAEEEPPQTDDWRSALPEEIKDTVLKEFDALDNRKKELEHYHRSNEGRVSALQRKIDTLTTQLRSVTAPQPQAPQPQQSKPDNQVDGTEDPILLELKESDPALYEALKVVRSKEREEYKKELDKTRSEFLNAIRPVQQNYQREYLAREVAKVKAVVPEIERVLASQEWREYLNEAPPIVTQMADSPDADTFLRAVELFALHVSRNSPAAPAAAPQNPAPATNKVTETRDRKLHAAAPVQRSQTQPIMSEVDFDTALEREFNSIMKLQGR